MKVNYWQDVTVYVDGQKGYTAKVGDIYVDIVKRDNAWFSFCELFGNDFVPLEAKTEKEAANEVIKMLTVLAPNLLEELAVLAEGTEEQF